MNLRGEVLRDSKRLVITGERRSLERSRDTRPALSVEAGGVGHTECQRFVGGSTGGARLQCVPTHERGLSPLAEDAGLH